MRIFRRVYYAAAATTLAAAACLPALVPLSFRLLGYDPRLARADTAASFQAYRATAALRRGLALGVLVLALGLVALSIAALVLRGRRRTDIPWAALAATTVGAAVAAAVAFAGLLAPGGMCC